MSTYRRDVGSKSVDVPTVDVGSKRASIDVPDGQRGPAIPTPGLMDSSAPA
jgi:hypothetical protein